jgi:hypothetical protein
VVKIGKKCPSLRWVALRLLFPLGAPGLCGLRFLGAGRLTTNYRWHTGRTVLGTQGDTFSSPSSGFFVPSASDSAKTNTACQD